MPPEPGPTKLLQRKKELEGSRIRGKRLHSLHWRMATVQQVLALENLSPYSMQTPGEKHLVPLILSPQALHAES